MRTYKYTMGCHISTLLKNLKKAKGSIFFFTFFLFPLLLLFYSFNGAVQAAINPPLSQYESQVVDSINAERKKANLSAVRINEKLVQAARAHNNLMNSCTQSYSINTCFKHQITQLSEPKLMDRINQTGYNASSVSEIIAWGQKTPQAVVAAWMNSSGHKAQILNTTRPDIGCAYVNGSSIFWTCDFGKSNSSSQNPTPTPTSNPTTSATSTPRPKATPTPTATPKTSPPAGGSPTPTASPLEKPRWCERWPHRRLCQ